MKCNSLKNIVIILFRNFLYFFAIYQAIIIDTRKQHDEQQIERHRIGDREQCAAWVDDSAREEQIGCFEIDTKRLRTIANRIEWYFNRARFETLER